jgi:hydrogenase maturation protein HypF
MIANSCEEARIFSRLNRCALSGGTFQNRLLLDLCVKELKQREFDILLHSLVPPNDGGIALGQALAAAVLNS